MTIDLASGLTFGGRAAADETVPVRQIGQWALVWRRFSRHRLAFWSMRVLFLIAVLGIIGPAIAPSIPTDIYTQHIPINAPPRVWPFDLRYLMGTDATGTSVSTYVLAGAQPTLEIGFLGALVASIVGSLIGATAGYFGRYVDALLMRIVDALLTVPFLPLLMVLATLQTDHSALTYGLMFGFVGWPQIARLVRGNILSLRSREFADAARALGGSDIRIILRHFLPNTLDIVIVATTLNVALFIIADVSLGFVVGSTAGGDLTWGTAFGVAFGGIQGGYWWTLIPAIFLLATVLSVNFVGDGLRDALDVESGHEVGDPGKRPHLEARALTVLLGGVRLAAQPAVALAGTSPAIRARQTVTGWASSGNRTIDRLLPRAEGTSLLSRIYRSPPWWLRVFPIVALLLAGEVVMLYSHSPLIYAANFPAPTTYPAVRSGSPFDVASAAGNRWDLLEFTPSGVLRLVRVDSGGRTFQNILMTKDAPQSDVSLVENGGARLGIWMSSDASTIRAGLVSGANVRELQLNPGGGLVEHPYAFAAPGGFEVVYGWQPLISQGPIRIYGSFVSTSGKASPPRVLVSSKRHGLFPHGLIDARGRMDLWWMEYRGNDQWSWMFRRFTPLGRPLSKPLDLEEVGFAPLVKGLGKLAEPDAVPAYWAYSQTTDPSGNIWVAWADDQGTSISEWNRRGTLTYPPTSLQNGGGAATQGQNLPGEIFSLVGTSRGFQLYGGGPSLINGGSSPYAQAYDANANPIPPLFERVEYSGGGNAVDPHALTANGGIQVFWEKGRIGSATIVGTSFVRDRPPDLFTRLGLNVGNPLVNALLVLGGSIGAGIAFGLANVAIVIALLLIWGVISIVVPRRLRWPVYAIMLALVLVWLFNPSAAPPGWVFIIHGLGWPGGWIAALGGAFVGIWSGLFLFRRFEPVFRAVSIAFASVFFVAALYAVTVIQGQITQI